MAQLATEDHKVRAQRVADRAAEATEDYAAPVEDGDWRGLLKITDKQCQGDCGGIAVWMVFGVDFHDFRIAACHGV